MHIHISPKRYVTKEIKIRPVKIHILLFFGVFYKGNIIIHEWIKIFKKPKSAIQSGNLKKKSVDPNICAEE